MSGGYNERKFASDQEAATAIRRAIKDSNGSMVLAARVLGLSYRSLSRYVKKLGLRDEIKSLKGQGVKPRGEVGSMYKSLASSFAYKAPKS